jgi:hypothetical protein
MNSAMTAVQKVTIFRSIPVLSVATCDSVSRCFTSTTADGDAKPSLLYLHVGPSGDCWTGSSIFAAKHLQPDYVKSIPLHPPHYDICADTLIEILEEDGGLARELYDTETLTKKLQDQVRKSMKGRRISHVKP